MNDNSNAAPAPRQITPEERLDNLIAVAANSLSTLNQEMKANNVNRENRRRIIRELIKAAK